MHKAGQEGKCGMLAFSTATGKHFMIIWLITSGNWHWKADGNRTGCVPSWCGLKLPRCNQITPDSWGTGTSNTSEQMMGILLHLKDSSQSSVLPSQYISPATFTQNGGRPEGDGHSSMVLSRSLLNPWGRTLMPPSQPGPVLMIPYYHMQQMRNHQIWKNELEEVQLLLIHGTTVSRESILSLWAITSVQVCAKSFTGHIFTAE